jgi:sulfur-carrier protein adenylyltransferase/sulfurtransferase
VKIAAGLGKPMIGKFYVYNALEAFHKTIEVMRNPECPLCGKNPSITELKEAGSAINACP